MYWSQFSVLHSYKVVLPCSKFLKPVSQIDVPTITPSGPVYKQKPTNLGPLVPVWFYHHSSKIFTQLWPIDITDSSHLRTQSRSNRSVDFWYFRISPQHSAVVRDGSLLMESGKESFGILWEIWQSQEFQFHTMLSWQVPTNPTVLVLCFPGKFHGDFIPELVLEVKIHPFQRWFRPLQLGLKLGYPIESLAL